MYSIIAHTEHPTTSVLNYKLALQHQKMVDMCACAIYHRDVAHSVQSIPPGVNEVAHLVLASRFCPPKHARTPPCKIPHTHLVRTLQGRVSMHPRPPCTIPIPCASHREGCPFVHTHRPCSRAECTITAVPGGTGLPCESRPPFPVRFTPRMQDVSYMYREGCAAGPRQT